MTATDILIYVEDPGAANYVAGLLEAVDRRGCVAELYAAGSGATHLRSLGTPFEQVSTDDAVATLLDRVPPRVVAVGTSEDVDTPAFDLIAEARRRGLVSVGLVDGPSNADHRFRGRSQEPLAHAPDWILVADAAVREQFVTLGASPDRILTVGHPRYDTVLALGHRLLTIDRPSLRNRYFPDASPDRPVLVFLTELSDGVNPDRYHRTPDYTLQGRGDVDGRTEIVLEEVLDAVRDLAPRPYVVLRLHPKNTAADFAPWLGEIDLLHHGGPADSLLESLYAADLVVGLTTILMMEAALLGRPTLSVVPRPSEASWLPSIGLGLTPCVTEREVLRARLPDMLADGWAPRSAVADVVETGAAERVAGVLCDLARPTAAIGQAG